MSTPLVMTILAQDRPGIVESLARLVADQGGNWLESRMCRLGGKFAGILRVSVPPERQAGLAAALRDLGATGLSVTVDSDQPPPEPPVTHLATIDFVGHDRPGIVRQIAAVLAGRGVNVEELVTGCSSAPMSGEALFKASATLRLPEATDLAALRTDLERIAADLQVDIVLEPLIS